jgi:hypothetical protein
MDQIDINTMQLSIFQTKGYVETILDFYQQMI